jgi:azurin
LEFSPGLNVLEMSFKNLRGGPPAVHLFDSVGQQLTNVTVPTDAKIFAGLQTEYAKMIAEQGQILRIQAAPELHFAPTEVTVQTGSRVRLIFDNPDLMIHNFVLCAPDSVEEIGALADKLAAMPDGLAKQYIPDSPKILHHTKLVSPKAREELVFDAPKAPGRYPYICTFPGHWRIMKGTMIVEKPSPNQTLKSQQEDGLEAALPRETLPIRKTTDHTSNGGGAKDASALFNHTTKNASGGSNTTDDGKTFRGYGKGDFLEIQLDTSAHPKGFDITGLTTVTGHGDARSSQAYSVSIALLGAPTKFIPLTETSMKQDGGAVLIRLQGIDSNPLENAGTKATGVAAVRLDFNDGAAGYNVYREIAITGQPSR